MYDLDELTRLRDEWYAEHPYKAWHPPAGYCRFAAPWLAEADGGCAGSVEARLNPVTQEWTGDLCDRHYIRWLGCVYADAERRGGVGIEQGLSVYLRDQKRRKAAVRRLRRDKLRSMGYAGLRLLSRSYRRRGTGEHPSPS